MTSIHKHRQTWDDRAEDIFFNMKIMSISSYKVGISDFKSSLKRDIEKRKLLIQNDVTIPEWVRGLKMEECNLFLELIETVEP